MELISILDNGGETYDRYTITIADEEGKWFCLGANENPFSPTGFGQFCGDYGFENDDSNPEIGLPVDLQSVPEPVQRYIANFMAEEET